MQLAPTTLNLVKLLHQAAGLTLSLQHTQTILRSLQKQDPNNVELYRLLARPNQLLHQRLLSLREHWNQHPATNWLQLELLTLVSLAQTHCQLVGWLAQGDASSAGPQFSLPQPPAPSVPPQDSKGPAVPALGFD